MGFLTVVVMVIIEIVGAPFWKNCSVVIALLICYFISMGMTYSSPTGPKSYVNFKFTKKTAAEMPIAFFWIKTFPYGFEPAAILPLICAFFFVSSAETVGDIGATCDASDIPAIGPDADTRVQGGLLSDGVNSFLAALLTTSPNTTYSQNSGVIAITRCASRAAGCACATWLTLFGLIGPLGGFCSDIPACVLGGMVTFLFANVMVSGIQIIAGIGVGRRNRIILAFALGIGLGVGMQPNFIEGGGSATFFGDKLRMNYGFYPQEARLRRWYPGLRDHWRQTVGQGVRVQPRSHRPAQCRRHLPQDPLLHRHRDCPDPQPHHADGRAREGARGQDDQDRGLLHGCRRGLSALPTGRLRKQRALGGYADPRSRDEGRSRWLADPPPPSCDRGGIRRNRRL